MYAMLTKFGLFGILQYLFISLLLGTGFEKDKKIIVDDKSQIKHTVSIEKYLETETKEVLLGDQKIAMLALGLGWEDGYHTYITEDEELISQILSEVRNLRICTDKQVDTYTCDAGVDLLFYTQDGKSGVIQFNDTCLVMQMEDGKDQLWQVEDMNSLWELCLKIYDEGE